MKNKVSLIIFFSLVALSLLAPLWVFKDLLFPFVTSKAFYFRVLIELALPFYIYLVLSAPALRPNLKQPLNVLALVFLLINIITSFTGINISRSLWGNFERMGGSYYIAHLTLLYFYVVLLGQASEKWLKRFIYVFLAAALVVAINGIFGKLGLATFVADPSLPSRVSSTLGNPIYIGSFLIIPMLLALFLGFEEENKVSKAGYGIAALLQVICILLSGTRGALVGLVGGGFVSACLYLIFIPRGNLKTYGWSVLGLLTAAAVLLFVYSDRLPQGPVWRIFKLHDSNTESRLIQWGSALEGFKARPILGVGPENYYYIGNLYFNPAIYKYDSSWFDKPHNYILEILVTNGIFGLLAYLGFLFFAGRAFYKAYKLGYFSTAGFAALFCALLAYQIQNLTVFDTVPASISFYSLMGFAAYLEYAVLKDGRKILQNKSSQAAVPPSLPVASAIVAGAFMFYAVIVTNIVPAQASKAVNYGYAYSSVDLDKAMGYFETALNNPMNFDETETASKFSFFASQLIQSAQTPQQKQRALEILQKAIDYQNQVLRKNDTYAASWESLAGSYFNKSVISGQNYDYRTEEAVNRALELAPKRLEARQQIIQILLLKNNLNGAAEKLRELIKAFPSNKEIKAQAGLVEQALGNNKLALEWFSKAYEQGYKFRNYQEAKMLGDEYSRLGQWEKVIKLYEETSKADPSNVDLAVALAKAYSRAGQFDKAKLMVENIVRAFPQKAKELEGVAAETAVK